MSLSMLVAPFTGAWIEIGRRSGMDAGRAVAPFTGAWIEIRVVRMHWNPLIVAPFTGAWIEITTPWRFPPFGSGHSLHRSMNWKTDCATLNYPDSIVF